MFSKILRIFKKKIDGKTEDEWLSEGDILYEQGRYEEALECFNKVLEINPNCADAWSRKGLTLARLERYEEAIRCFDRSLSIREDPEVIRIKKKVKEMLEEKRIREIIEDAKKVISRAKSQYNVKEAEDVLHEAEEAFKRGEYSRAEELALEARDKAIGYDIRWKYKTSSIVNSVSITPDGEYIVAGSEDDHVYLFNREGELLWRLEIKR